MPIWNSLDGRLLRAMLYGCIERSGTAGCVVGECTDEIDVVDGVGCDGNNIGGMWAIGTIKEGITGATDGATTTTAIGTKGVVAVFTGEAVGDTGAGTKVGVTLKTVGCGTRMAGIGAAVTIT